MPAAVRLRTDYSAADFPRLARVSKDSNQSRRFLSLAAIVEGRSREKAARIGGMDRLTLRDWVHRFNEFGADGPLDRHGGGVEPPSESQLSELAGTVEAGPDSEKDGVKERFNIELHERYVGVILGKLGFSTSVPDLATPGRTSKSLRRSKKLRDRIERPSRGDPQRYSGRTVVPG